ncbi:MAG: hypothetical protein HY537_05835 [Deltaproteobacteria bacterium]|nr:hypothetical protein [Deltaproteobacteria bacterium]
MSFDSVGQAMCDYKWARMAWLLAMVCTIGELKSQKAQLFKKPAGSLVQLLIVSERISILLADIVKSVLFNQCSQSLNHGNRLAGSDQIYIRKVGNEASGRQSY